MRRGLTVIAATLASLGVQGLASVNAGADPVQAYQANDGLGFHDVLPPGANGLDNAAQLGAYELNGTRPAHSNDQLGMYRDLVYAAPNLRPEDLGKYYKDSSFGVPPGGVERTETPRADVTILRDRGFGVPHVYGSTRSGVMFGAGYAAAEDRLFFIDVLRHAGRAQLASFIGGSPGNRSMDASTLQIAPYTESDLQAQIDRLPQLYGADGQRVLDDSTSFVAGINQYISEAKLDPGKLPAEYAALGHPAGPDPWKLTDIVSEAALVGGIFGKGGGTQLAWAQILQGFAQRFGQGSASQLWQDWRSPNDPEAPTTVHRGSFPYQTSPARPASDSVALPDAGSLTPARTVTTGTGSGTPSAQARRASPLSGLSPGRSALGGALSFPRSSSNALLVAGAHTVSGHPIAVMGPQVGYFTPQILMEEDLHGPGIDARGAAFSGVNLYVELGRGRDYAWSATSAGQAIIDDFAVDLCNPDGSPPTKDSRAYMLRGSCVTMDPVTVTESWTPNPADTTPPGSQTMTVQRTKYGNVIGRATVNGKPVAYTELRTTYNHEVDSAIGFADFNDPNRIHNVQDFQHAAYRIGYTFNWMYADNRDIGYFNSGNNPVRDPRSDPLLPVAAKYEWRNLNTNLNIADYTPFDQHPQVVNQDFLSSWNNKQAQDYGAADGFYGPVYRSQTLDDRIRAGIADGHRMSLTGLVNAMEDAGTVDLRGDKDLPWMLKVIGTPTDPRLADAVSKLRAWSAAGAHRRAPSPSAPYDHSQAIQIMDAWFPLAVEGMFKPSLGDPLYQQLTRQIEIDNAPNNHGSHLGSAYDNGWYGYVQKDLRDLLAQGAGPASTPSPRGCRKRQRSGRRRGRRGRHRQRRRRAGIRHGRSRQRACVRRRRRPARHAAAHRHHRHRHHRRTGAPQSGSPATTAVLGSWHKIYCGNGDLAACRDILQRTLSQALDADPAKLYADGDCASAGYPGGAQKCFDSISFRAVGAITQPLTAWVNRPTYQQADEIQGHR